MFMIAARSEAPQVAAFYVLEFYGLVACHPALDVFMEFIISSTYARWINLTFFCRIDNQ